MSEEETAQIRTPESIHKGMLQNVRQELKIATNQDHLVEPVTSDSDPEIKAEDFEASSAIPIFEQVSKKIVGVKVGQSPAKIFLSRLIDRFKRKHPGKKIKME